MKKIDRNLIEFAQAGKAQDVVRLLNLGASPMICNRRGQNALHEAARAGSLECVQALWPLSDPYQNCSPQGFCAITHAAHMGKLEVMVWMAHQMDASKHMDLNLFKKVMWMSVLMAAQGNHTDCMKALHPWFFPEVYDQVVFEWETGWTPMMRAATQGHQAAVECCIRLGWGQVNAQNSAGATALMMAAYHGHSSLIEWLLQTLGPQACAIDAANTSGASALSHAAERGDAPSVKALLKAGARLVHSGAAKWIKITPMSVDFSHSNQAAAELWSCVDMILEAGGDPLDRNYRGETLLMQAVKSRDRTRVQRYKNDSSHRLVDYDGWSALHFAAHIGCRFCVELLRDDSLCTLRNKHGNTPLMLAAIQGRTACAVALMNHSHLSAHNKKGETAFMIAVQGAWLSLAKKLRQKGSDVNLHTKTGSAPLMVCARDNMWALYDSIGSGMDLNYKDHEGWTALMHAARYDNVEMVERLIAAGADTLTQDESGYCALSHAARSNALRTAALLLNSVSALQADEDGRTPLMHAARMGHLDMVKLLIPWSDISQVNERGWTAADIAFKEGEHDVFELLAAYQISTLERHQLEELCDPVHALDPMVMRV